MAMEDPSCSACHLRDLCVPAGLGSAELSRLDLLVASRQQVSRGEALFRATDAFHAVFAIAAGSFKTSLPMPTGDGQITGFHMAGDLLGLTGIADGVMACDAIALEDAQVCVIDFDQLEALSRESAALQRRFHRFMSAALVHDQTMMQLLASGRAGERVAAFLVQLSRRQQSLGLSAELLELRMSREELANFLGLRIETISRCLSQLQRDGVIDVRGRRVRVLSAERLRELARPQQPSPTA